MHEGYRKYLDILKAKGMSNPMSEKQWREAVGIPEVEHVPFVARKSASAKKVMPTLENHEVVKKEPRPVKPKKEPRPVKPKKEPRPVKPKKEPKPRQTEEEKRAYRREWARKFREKNPGAAYKYSKAWKEKNPEKVREWNRLYMRRKRAAERLKNG